MQWCMHRTDIYLSDEQIARLDARARSEGMSRAELVRQVLDRALHGDPDRTAAELAAVTDSFGALPGDEVTLDRRDGARGAHLDRVANL